jgi:hypothetical protein
MWSPWLIHTVAVSLGSKPANSAARASADLVAAVLAPAAARDLGAEQCAMSCMP